MSTLTDDPAEPSAATGSDPTCIRVASIPQFHVYVWHIRDQDDAVVHLPDTERRQWYPPERLDPHWIERHPDDFDVFHVHFGFDHRPPSFLEDVCEALAARKKPLVFTAHDLHNPHHEDQTLHREQLAVWMRHADAVITLTGRAAEEIRTLWGRTAVVIPHPHVVELDRLALRPPAARGGPVVGVHFKSFRQNMIGAEIVDPLVRACHDLGARARFDLHEELVEDERPQVAELVPALQAVAEAGHAEVRLHPFYRDDELFDYLQSLAVSVLPYRFGTHSGWLEACHDLATSVLAPACGCYAAQGADATYRYDGRLDPSSLRDGLERALRSPRPRWTAAERRHQRTKIAAAHRRLYTRLLEVERRSTGGRR